MKLNRRSLLQAGVGALLWGAWPRRSFAQQEAEAVTIPLANFNWSSWVIAQGSFSYRPVAEGFEVSLQASQLKSDHEYEVHLVAFDPQGGRWVSKTPLTTDAAGSAQLTAQNEQVTETKLPMFQVHVFVVDPQEASPPQAPPPITGITHGAPLVCLYPAGFRLQR